MVETSLSSGVLPSRQRILFELYPRALPPVTHGSALQAPECMWRPIRGIKKSRGWVFIYVYRLAMDAEPCGVMVWLTENVQACLRDFQTGTASMARKRHLASSARGFLCFCLMTLVTTGLIRLIRLIRGRKKKRPCLWKPDDSQRQGAY